MWIVASQKETARGRLVRAQERGANGPLSCICFLSQRQSSEICGLWNWNSVTCSSSSPLMSRPDCNLLLDFQKSVTISLVFPVLRFSWLSLHQAASIWIPLSVRCLVVVAVGGDPVMGVQREQGWTWGHYPGGMWALICCNTSLAMHFMITGNRTISGNILPCDSRAFPSSPSALLVLTPFSLQQYLVLQLIRGAAWPLPPYQLHKQRFLRYLFSQSSVSDHLINRCSWVLAWWSRKQSDLLLKLK